MSALSEPQEGIGVVAYKSLIPAPRWRHDYESISAPVMWALVHNDLPDLEKACRDELAAGPT
jgi:uncharacterized protein with HEPN domain